MDERASEQEREREREREREGEREQLDDEYQSDVILVDIWFGLVSLFNLRGLFNAKTILVEEP